MELAIRIMRAFMTNVKRPKVTIVIGRVRMISTGFIRTLIIPRTTAVTRAAVKLAICTPGRRYEAAIMTSALITQLIKIFISLFWILWKLLSFLR